jgi:hypothetical protein
MELFGALIIQLSHNNFCPQPWQSNCGVSGEIRAKSLRGIAEALNAPWNCHGARWKMAGPDRSQARLRGPAKSLGIRLSRRCPDPWSDLARLGLAADWTRPSLERNPIANCLRVQCNNAGAAKEQHYAGVVVRLDNTASCFRAVYFNLTCFCHRSLLLACGVACRAV